jgi:hypothetical protein
MTVSIPTQCNQDWQTFTPTANGGFCSSCKKEVVDFTTWEPEEIRAYFLKRPHGSCGKFRASQLGNYPSSSKLNVGSAMKWIAPSLITASLTLSSAESSAQNIHELIVLSADSQPDQNESTLDRRLLVPREIRGKVMDDANGPIPGVNVQLKGTTTGTVTNADGEFNLIINRTSETDTLVFSFIGYLNESISINQKEFIDVVMQPDKAILSEVIIVGGVCAYRWYLPRGMWYKIKGLFRRRR